MGKRIIIAGTCSFDDYDLMCRFLDRYLSNYLNNDLEIVSGHAKGADSLGERYAIEHNIKNTVFEAKWKKFGKKAGPIRNTEMIEYAYKDNGELIAFWNGKSRGTMDTISKALRKCIKCSFVLYETDDHVKRVFTSSYETIS